MIYSENEGGSDNDSKNTPDQYYWNVSEGNNEIDSGNDFVESTP